MDTTCDGLLNHRLQIYQPKAGFRIAIVTVLLAAAVPVRMHQSVLDIGCGVGGAMLCLACRVPQTLITGIDIQEQLIDLCRYNIDLNRLSGHLNAIALSVKRLSGAGLGPFNHIMINPPYHDGRYHGISPDRGKSIANTEQDGDLAVWIEIAANVLLEDGVLTLIHRADRLSEILAMLSPFFDRMDVLPILTKKGSGYSECRPLVLHEADGGYTSEANAVLRDAEALTFNSPRGGDI